MFLYTASIAVYYADPESELRPRFDEWVETANELFGNGTSGVRLKVAGVRAAPEGVDVRDVFREGRVAPDQAVLAEAIAADQTIRHQRADVGGDIVTVVGKGSPASPWT